MKLYVITDYKKIYTEQWYTTDEAKNDLLIFKKHFPSIEIIEKSKFLKEEKINE